MRVPPPASPLAPVVTPSSHAAPPEGPREPEHKPLATVCGLKKQLLIAGAGVATLGGLFELTGPIIHMVHASDPNMLLALRAGATAAIGATGGVAVTLIESAYATLSRAAVDARRDRAPFREKLTEAVAEQRHELPKELTRAVALSGGAGALLSGAAAFFPTGVVITGASAVALSLLYSLGELGVAGVKSVLALRRSKQATAAGDATQAVAHRNAAREHVRDAGRALLETVTIATISHHVLHELGELVMSDHASTTTFAASSAEQLPNAVESIAEVAETIEVAAREAAAFTAFREPAAIVSAALEAETSDHGDFERTDADALLQHEASDDYDRQRSSESSPPPPPPL